MTRPAIAAASDEVMQLTPRCACGGGCPRCHAAALQRKPRISVPGDRFEREADEVADQVMRMAQPAPIGAAGDALQRNCSVCEDEDKPRIQRDASPPHDTATLDPDAAARATTGGGAPLARDLRAYFEPRFGHDFGAVRVHNDGAASAGARAVQARAYTLGRHIVFDAGEYAPETTSGKRLLAHELTHVIQQSGAQAGAMNDGPTLQRTLKVDTEASEDPKTAVATIKPLVIALCPGFDIAATGEITPTKGSDCAGKKFGAVAAGKRKVGCCCLCTLTDAAEPWRIVVGAKGPETSVGLVSMTPTSGPAAPKFRYWTGTTPEKMQVQPFTEAFGHELCGHAALLQIKAHPPPNAPLGRAFSDTHDPTIRVENALATEMGLKGDRRGFAGSGSHRGESLRVFSIGPYAVDADDPLPIAKQVKAATDFLDANERTLIDEVGLRDKHDTKATISKSRADKVEAELKKGLKKDKVEVRTEPKKSPETLNRVQPATDGGVGAERIVELRMAVMPAGLAKPIGATPPATPVHVDPEFPDTVKALKAGGKGVNPCHALLSQTAWP